MDLLNRVWNELSPEERASAASAFWNDSGEGDAHLTFCAHIAGRLHARVKFVE